jgi:hypothetical protein
MKKLLALGLVAASLSGSAVVYAKWVSAAKVTRVRVDNKAPNYSMDIWFDRDVAEGCTTNTRVTLATTDAGLLEAVRQVAITAKLSNRDVEVSTIGCQGNYGKLDFMSLK